MKWRSAAEPGQESQALVSHEQRTQDITYPLLFPFFFFWTEALLYSHCLLHSLTMQEKYLVFRIFTCPLPALSLFPLSPDHFSAVSCSSPKVYSSQVNLGYGWGTQTTCTYLTSLTKSHWAFTFENPFSLLAHDSFAVPRACAGLIYTPA